MRKGLLCYEQRILIKTALAAKGSFEIQLGSLTEIRTKVKTQLTSFVSHNFLMQVIINAVMEVHALLRQTTMLKVTSSVWWLYAFPG